MGLANFFSSIRKSLFGGRMTEKQVEGILQILDECEKRKVSDNGQIAYLLATAFHETARTMQPIKEYGGTRYLKSKKYWPFFGRGYVQITWESNYRDWGRRLGLDLVANPDLALIPETAATILVEGSRLGTFTGKKLADYIKGARRDFRGARLIINGTDKAALIAGHAEKFLKALS